jgi:hypothetical protein
MIHSSKLSCWNIWSCKEFKLSYRSVPNLLVIATFIRVPTRSLLESRIKMNILIKMLRDVGLVNICYFDPGPQGYPVYFWVRSKGFFIYGEPQNVKKGKDNNTIFPRVTLETMVSVRLGKKSGNNRSCSSGYVSSTISQNSLDWLLLFVLKRQAEHLKN